MKPLQNIEDIKHLLYTTNELKKISRRLNRLFVSDCNNGDNPRRGKAEQKLIQKAKELAAAIDLYIYVQGDPRGASLYLLDNKDEATQANYNTRGIALY